MGRGGYFNNNSRRSGGDRRVEIRAMVDLERQKLLRVLKAQVASTGLEGADLEEVYERLESTETSVLRDCANGFTNDPRLTKWGAAMILTSERLESIAAKRGLLTTSDADALLAHTKAMDALLALIVDKLQEAGGTLDHKLRHQIVMDLQQDIRQGAENAADYWIEERKIAAEKLTTAQARIVELEGRLQKQGTCKTAKSPSSIPDHMRGR